eukprot:m.6200 g.6200  ORF g.6200 m.6200 type:complete len:324 (+) comp3496_c0_seq1:145-1116(+)
MSNFSLGSAKKSVTSQSKEYLSFRNSVALKTVQIDHDTEQKNWQLYDYGPRQVRCPLIFLPPVSGTADVYFKQQLSLGTSGTRVISVKSPPCWTVEEWCEGFLKLLDHLRIDQVHIFGASLGAFLAQKFAQYTVNSQRVLSLILCNGFTDTDVFQHSMPAASTYKFMPSFVMKRILLSAYTKGDVESEIANSIDFMVERVDLLSRLELASRLTLNLLPNYVEPQHLAAQGIKVMLLNVMDRSAITSKVVDDMQKCYPDAKDAQLKDGGNFPYLARDQEVTMYIKVHLRQFAGTRHTAGDEFDWGQPSEMGVLEVTNTGSIQDD